MTAKPPLDLSLYLVIGSDAVGVWVPVPEGATGLPARSTSCIDSLSINSVSRNWTWLSPATRSPANVVSAGVPGLVGSSPQASAKVHMTANTGAASHRFM